MISIDVLEKRCQQWSKALLEEATPLVQAPPRIRTSKLGEQVKLGEALAQGLKAQIPFMKGNLRPDLLVFHDLQTAHGPVHVVLTYSGLAVLPVDFLMKVDGRLPKPVLMNRGMLGIGFWGLGPGAQDERKDPFCSYLGELQRDRHHLKQDIKWDLNLGGGTKVELKWAVQLIPLSESSYVIQLHQPYDWGLTGIRFSLRKYLEVMAWLRDSILKFNYAGNLPAARLLAPNPALLALPEFAGEPSAA